MVVLASLQRNLEQAEVVALALLVERAQPPLVAMGVMVLHHLLVGHQRFTLAEAVEV
jgi:hypothetical protein